MRIPQLASSRRSVPAALIVGLAGLAGLLVAVGAPASAAQGASAAHPASDEARLLSAVNAAREAAGLPAYVPRADLAAAARAHATRMAAGTNLYHDQGLHVRVRAWSALGDNVGEARSARGIHRAFLASPPHRANILDPEFTEVGIGTARDGEGQLWVTEIFRRPA